ncbi:MAG: HipA domain-containing protein [Cyclobacteriaceae bacterium]|nr:HipA domain-containing protein [Cyclobacteriaceae bacterium]
MGILYSEQIRGKDVFSFSYDKAWLGSGFALLLDPDLQFYHGPQYLDSDVKPNFGMFLDSSPDRWGRLLMRRREAAEARLHERKENMLFEADFLLGVFDGSRMGGLRFKTTREGPFLSNNERLASPPWTSIRALEQISLRLEDDDVMDDPEYLNWLNMLVAPGSSLGGARPKANILDPKGNLWIAKFPSKKDHDDTGAWEMVTYKMAVAAGIHMAESQAHTFSNDRHTFLTKRFDRANGGGRIHFASAMTQLGYIDGQGADEGVSYLELVEFIQRHGARVNEDLRELWKRIVFNICVSNTDDHLRNHGFLLSSDGWVLSPAYDINPVETGTGLKLNITENDNSLDLDLAMEVHEFFRLNKRDAEQIIETVRKSVRYWRDLANQYGIARAQQELKAFAFRNSED